MAGRGPRSDVSIDRYRDDDRRSHVSRGPRSRAYDERYRAEEVEYRRGSPREREREVREKEVIIREDVRERERERPRVPPQFIDEDYGRPPPGAGAMVLRARETEEFDFAPRPRRRSPSPEPEKKIEKEEIIIRTDESDTRSAPRRRERSRDREEIIITKTEDDRDRRGPPHEEREREEIIIRTEKRDDDVISRRGGRGGDYERDEIIIRRDERDSDSYVPRSRYDDYAPIARPVSHERERSRTRGRSGSVSDEEIIIRREGREGRNGDRERQEIIIRKSSRSRSPSPSTVSTRRGHAPDPPLIRPPIHQDVYTHHHHIDHGYDMALAARPRAVSRPPSPPMPPSREAEDRIEIHRSGERNGRAYDEDIVIDRNEGPSRARSRSPPPRPSRRDPYYDYDRDRPHPPGFLPGAIAPYAPVPLPGAPAPNPPGYLPGALAPYRPSPSGYDRDVAGEADYYDDIARRRAYPGEAYHGATRDWAIVDVPPGTQRVRMDGAGGGEQEITWQRYNGVRRSKFRPDGSDDGYDRPGAGMEVARPLPGAGGVIGPSYGPRPRDPKEGLWTEITKDLVVKEAILEMGYEYEETDDFYYVMKYLGYEDIARLVGLSEDIRKDRRKRVKEMEWENRVESPPLLERPRPLPLPIEDRPPRPMPLPLPDRGWDREDERYIEREVVYRGGRPPPPIGWRPPPRYD